MVFLDAFALIALLLDEEIAPQVEEIVAREPTAVTSVNLAEAVDVCCRVRRLQPGDLDAVLVQLLGDPILVLAPGAEDARAAGLIRAAYYRRRGSALSLADCFLLAAPAEDDSIATADAAILTTAAQIGVAAVSLT